MSCRVLQIMTVSHLLQWLSYSWVELITLLIIAAVVGLDVLLLEIYMYFILSVALGLAIDGLTGSASGLLLLYGVGTVGRTLTFCLFTFELSLMYEYV